eukprot:214462-Amorphochlora_amoeboformis.AAC.1
MLQNTAPFHVVPGQLQNVLVRDLEAISAANLALNLSTEEQRASEEKVKKSRDFLEDEETDDSEDDFEV